MSEMPFGMHSHCRMATCPSIVFKMQLTRFRTSAISGYPRFSSSDGPLLSMCSLHNRASLATTTCTSTCARASTLVFPSTPSMLDRSFHNSVARTPPRPFHNCAFLTVGDVFVSIPGACWEDRVLWHHHERTSEARSAGGSAMSYAYVKPRIDGRAEEEKAEETRWRRVGETNDDDRWWWAHEACTKRDEARHEQVPGTIRSCLGQAKHARSGASVDQCTRSKKVC